jgi:hypothetical protein
MRSFDVLRRVGTRLTRRADFLSASWFRSVATGRIKNPPYGDAAMETL